MGWTKRQFIVQAYEEIGFSEYVFDIQPEQLEAALRRLDAMMAAWNVLGIKVGYPLPNSPGESDLDDETNVPDAAHEAIYTNLALRLAAPLGKLVSAETKKSARTAYSALLTHVACPQEMQFPTTLPKGAGQKPWQSTRPFTDKVDDNIIAPPVKEIGFE